MRTPAKPDQYKRGFDMKRGMICLHLPRHIIVKEVCCAYTCQARSIQEKVDMQTGTASM